MAPNLRRLKASRTNVGNDVLAKSGQRHRPVIIAMTAMRMMEAPVHEVVNVVTVRDDLVSARRAVRVI